jgi:hypothetical protein
MQPQTRTVVLRWDHPERNPVHIKTSDGTATLCGRALPPGLRGAWTMGTDNFEDIDYCQHCLRGHRRTA